VDDILSGADTLPEAVTRRDELIELLSRGKFELGKWAANHPSLMPSHALLASPSVSPQPVLPGQPAKMLGIMWCSGTDDFIFSFTPPDSGIEPVTKRSVLSWTARVSDPLGWISPVIVRAKFLLQDLWLEKSDWDSPLSTPLLQCWLQLVASLEPLPVIRIPRWTHLSLDIPGAELHAFCDASTRAYAASLYLRFPVSSDRFHTVLLIAKTKVAPTQTISVPRLELCAAQFGVRLLRHVQHEPRFSQSPVVVWSDSQVTLAWIKSHPSRWKTFVANRVSYIQSSLPAARWKYVSSAENPADVASQGTDPELLRDSALWWQGPPWLRMKEDCWPTRMPKPPSSPGEEAPRKLHTYVAQADEGPWDLITRYSSLSKLLRVTALCVRFYRRCRSRDASDISRVDELRDAKLRLIRYEQSRYYFEELSAIARRVPLPRRSSLLPLHPLVSPDGTIRVGGRLENSCVPVNERHPPILHKTSPLVPLFIASAHASVLHAGASLTTSFLLRQVWIPGARSVVKKFVRACVHCFRFRPRHGGQLMGQLPSSRVTPSRPFSRTGLDYAGPILCRTTSGRGHKSFKAYIALFVCMATKAIHLEVVSDLTSSAFLAAYRKFVSRRGLCAELFSDNGTTFVGADAELRRMFRAASEFYKDVSPQLSQDGTSWSFIPPYAPHFGGLWEAGVKSVKSLLLKAVGSHTLTFEELTTVLAQVEACLNSRPLTPLSSDASDLSFPDWIDSRSGS
jgi:hypothetical protein